MDVCSTSGKDHFPLKARSQETVSLSGTSCRPDCILHSTAGSGSSKPGCEWQITVAYGGPALAAAPLERADLLQRLAKALDSAQGAQLRGVQVCQCLGHRVASIQDELATNDMINKNYEGCCRRWVELFRRALVALNGTGDPGLFCHSLETAPCGLSDILCLIMTNNHSSALEASV